METYTYRATTRRIARNMRAGNVPMMRPNQKGTGYGSARHTPRVRPMDSAKIARIAVAMYENVRPWALPRESAR